MDPHNLLSHYPFYNPWWETGEAAFADLPSFRREVFEAFCRDMVRLPEIISVAGPRRVCKSTLLKQCIHRLIQEHGPAQAAHLAYFTFDELPE